MGRTLRLSSFVSQKKKMVYYAKHPDHYEVMFLGETLDEVERFVNVLKIISDVYDK
jgi:hypothetical protein